MDPVVGSLVIAVLTLVARELRWHRVQGRERKERRRVEEERDELVRSMPPKARSMPPWEDAD